jgi:Predicted restriction endonuclease
MILVLGLYLTLPFGKMHSSNPRIIEMANLIGRTPSSVAMRLVNYASLDPMLQSRGVQGLAGGAEKCRSYWDEFSNNQEALLFECERIRASYEQTSVENKYRDLLKDIPDSLVGESRASLVQIRVNQSVFRQIVLANYGYKCALSGIDIPDLLVASHVIPWSENAQERMNPKNGICLSSLYDKAFDKGLISFSDQYHVMFSSRLKENVGKDYFAQYFDPISDSSLATRGLKYPVAPEFLEWHRDCVFEK